MYGGGDAGSSVPGQAPPTKGRRRSQVVAGLFFSVIIIVWLNTLPPYSRLALRNTLDSAGLNSNTLQPQSRGFSSSLDAKYFPQSAELNPDTLESAGLLTGRLHIPEPMQTLNLYQFKRPNVERPNMRAYFQSHWNPGTDEGTNCANRVRFGPGGDGGKLVCLDVLSLQADCFVLSVGVGGAPDQPPDFRFETDFHRHFPNCAIHVYDGTNFGRGRITGAPEFLTFFPENFTPLTGARYRGKRIDLFKIDCEGCEFTTIRPLLQLAHVVQINMELHGQNTNPSVMEEVELLMTTINKTHGIFNKEPNIEHSDGTCIEFAFLRRPKT